MIYLSWFLIIYGIILLVGYLLKFPFLYNNMKSVALIKLMGKKGFNIMLILVGIGCIILGLVLMPA